MTHQRKRDRDAVAQAEPLCVFASMGPTEVCDEPSIYMESPTDGDPSIIAVIKRIHREDLLHEALNHANFYRRDMRDTPPAPVPAPAAETVAWVFEEKDTFGSGWVKRCSLIMPDPAYVATGRVRNIETLVRPSAAPTDEISRLRRELDAAHDKYQRDVNGLNNEGDPIGGDPPMGWKQRAERAEALLAAPTDNICERCCGNGMILGDNGDPSICPACKGNTVQSAPTDTHPDDLAVDRFAAAMKAKLAAARSKGRNGWDSEACTDTLLAKMLVGHMAKGNPGNFEDIANLAMMLHQRGADPAVLRDAAPTDNTALVEARDIALTAIRAMEGAGPFTETGKDDDWRFRARLARKEALDAAQAYIQLAFDAALANRPAAPADVSTFTPEFEAMYREAVAATEAEGAPAEGDGGALADAARLVLASAEKHFARRHSITPENIHPEALERYIRRRARPQSSAQGGQA